MQRTPCKEVLPGGNLATDHCPDACVWHLAAWCACSSCDWRFACIRGLSFSASLKEGEKDVVSRIQKVPGTHACKARPYLLSWRGSAPAPQHAFPPSLWMLELRACNCSPGAECQQLFHLHVSSSTRRRRQACNPPRCRRTSSRRASAKWNTSSARGTPSSSMPPPAPPPVRVAADAGRPRVLRPVSAGAGLPAVSEELPELLCP